MARAGKRTYSKVAQEAALLLGQSIRLQRKQRGLSEKELAERSGVSRETIQRIERGDLKVGIGLFFEAACLVGVPLFDTSQERLVSHLERTQDKLALLPKTIRQNRIEVNDDF